MRAYLLELSITHLLLFMCVYISMYICMYLGLSIILYITQIRNNNINWNLKIYNYTNYETTTQHNGSVYVWVCL